VKVLKKQSDGALPVHAPDLQGREDFRKLPIVTITERRARDF